MCVCVCVMYLMYINLVSFLPKVFHVRRNALMIRITIVFYRYYYCTATVIPVHNSLLGPELFTSRDPLRTYYNGFVYTLTRTGERDTGPIKQFVKQLPPTFRDDDGMRSVRERPGFHCNIYTFCTRIRDKYGRK